MSYQLSGAVKENSHVLISVSLDITKTDTELSSVPDDKFTAIVMLALDNPKITAVTIHLADTLQRHRLPHEPEAEAITRRKGDCWLQGNRDMIAQLQAVKGGTLRRWDFWKTGDNETLFHSATHSISKMEEEDRAFRHDRRGLIGNFCAKARLASPSSYDHDAYYSGMAQYVDEECAGFAVMGRQPEHYDYELYFGDRNKVMRHISVKYGMIGMKALRPVLAKQPSRSSQFPFFASATLIADGISDAYKAIHSTEQDLSPGAISPSIPIPPASTASTSMSPSTPRSSTAGRFLSYQTSRGNVSVMIEGEELSISPEAREKLGEFLTEWMRANVVTRSQNNKVF